MNGSCAYGQYWLMNKPLAACIRDSSLLDKPRNGVLGLILERHHFVRAGANLQINSFRAEGWILYSL
jgi:hypothetical protein